MTLLKIDNIIFTGATSDVTLELSDIASSGSYVAATGLIDPATNNITTTGAISGGIFKTSGNVTVIDAQGGVSPYGLYFLPSGNLWSVASIGYNENNQLTIATITNTALSIALGKC
jgi:hypothetical protein